MALRKRISVVVRSSEEGRKRFFELLGWWLTCCAVRDTFEDDKAWDDSSGRISVLFENVRVGESRENVKGLGERVEL